MKLHARWAALACLIPGPVFAVPEIPEWFDGTASLAANADRADRAGVAPGEATVVLMRFGHTAPESVAAVVVAYDRCEALYAAVEQGARAEPDAALEIAEAVERTGRCPCSATELWSRSRLEQRLRLEIRAQPVGAEQPCLCQAAVAEAIARALPGRAEWAFDGLLDSGRRCDCAAPIMAAVANGLGGGSGWMTAQRRLAELSQRNDGRIVDVVAAKGGDATPVSLDRVALDTDVDAQACRAPWVDVEPGATTLSTEPRCAMRSRPALAIARFDADGRRRGVRVVNRSARAVDLAALPIVLDVHDDANERPERTIPLAGRLEPGAFLDVATEEPPRGFDDPALRSDDLALERVSLVALRQPDEAPSCAPEIAGVLQREAPIPIAAPPEPVIAGEPRTDESVVDPNRGGDLASPN